MQLPDVLSADQATIERAKVLVPFGRTERQARFLATVMLHAGMFVGRQYAAFADITHGGGGGNGGPEGPCSLKDFGGGGGS